MSSTNPKVDFYFKKAGKWQEQMAQLRSLALDLGLTEELKWGKPCYTLQGSNVVLIVGVTKYWSLLLPKGALMKDPDGLLIQPTENSQAARQIRFTGEEDIATMKAGLKRYIEQAIEVEKSGEEVQFKKTSEFSMPEEFQTALDENAALKTAFEALTPGRQRGYLLHFAAPKQSKTRTARVEKCAPQILAGKGLND